MSGPTEKGEENVSTGPIEIYTEPLCRKERAYDLLVRLQHQTAHSYDARMRRFAQDARYEIPQQPRWWPEAREILGADFIEPGEA